MFGWLHRLLFGKNGGKPKTKSSNLRRVSQKAPRRVPGQSTRTGSPGRSETARRSYIQRSSGQKRGNYGGSNYIPQEKKVQVKKPKKEAISKFDAYKKRLQESTSADKIAEDIKKLHERQNAANAEKAKKASSDAELKEISDAKARNLRELEGIKKKGGILDPRYVEDINKQIKHVKSKDFDKAYKKEKKKAVAKAAKEDLNRRLTMIGAKGLPAQHEEHKKVTKKIKKEAAAYEKKNQRKVLTTDQAMKAMAMARNSANNTKANGKNYDKKYFSDELREQIRANIQSDYDKGSVGTGFMSGSMPVGDLKKAAERTYGIKLDDTRARQKLGFNVAEMAGYLTKSYAFGGATEETIAKALTKVITKKTGKQAVGKAGKFAVNRAAEAIAATPVNLEDAARNSKDAKDFAKNVAINAGLDAGLGSVLDGGKFVAKAASDKATRKLLVKIDSGAELSDIERKSLQKKVTKVAGKKIAGGDLTEVEKKLYTKMHDGKIKKTLETKTTTGQSKMASSAIGGDTSHSLEPKKGSGTPSAEVPSEAPYTVDAKSPTTTSETDYTDASKNKEALRTTNIPPKASTPVSTSDNAFTNASKDNIANIEKESKVSRRLTPEDDAKYLATNSDNKGKRKTVKAYNEGRKVVLHGDDETKDYIEKAIRGKNETPDTVAYGKVNERLANSVGLVNPNVDIKDSYLELVPSDLKHAYEGHTKAKEPGDIDLPEEHFKNIPEYVDSFDDLLEVRNYPSTNSTKIKLGKRINGHTVIVEVVSKGRKSVNFKNMWGMDTDSYMKKYGLQKEKTMSVTSGDKSPNTSLSAAKSSFTSSSIPDASQNINIEAEKVDKVTPKMTADEVRKSVKEITDRELQTHGIKLMQSDTVSNDALRAEAMQAIKEGAFEKKAVKNSEVWEQAEKEISKDLEETYGHIMKLDGQPTSLDVARCYNLMIKFREQGDSKRWLEVCEKASGIMSETGRTLQAARMALRTTPEGRIRIVNRNIDYLNKKYADRLGGKKLELTDAQITKIMEATDDDAVAKVMNEINIETWNQIPATMFEKFNELRHCAMLLNPRTHIRNICGNMIFAPARTISGTISMGLEKGFSKKIAKMGGERTKSFVNRMSDDNLFKAARESFNMNYDASGSANRYIETHRPSDSSVFGGNAVGRVFEKVRQFNYKALEKEDMVTFRPVYEKSYAKYLKANELDPKKMTPEQKVKAHDIALQQAEYATYRDATKLSSMITKAKEKSATAKGENLLGTAVYRTGNVVMESMIPFAKTPINIARRGIDYSPIGLAKGIARVASAKNPEAFIKGLDDLGAGLTGTGIVALGGLFADLGYVTVNVGGKSGDPYYERDMGEQDYSINISIGGKEYSMSMDWAAPLNLPFFAGAAGFENLGKEGGGFADFVTGLAKIGEPLMEMSFMSGFTSLLQSNAKIDDGSAAGTIATNIMMTMPQQYLGSFIPSVLSQTANITDKYKRDTGSTSEDPVVKSWEQWARQQINKIPGLRQKLKKDVDVWGRYTEKKSTKDYIIEGIKATLCPATIKKKTYTDADRELIKLSKELDPETAQYIMPEDTFGYAFDLADGGRMKYSEKGKYQRERGQQNYKELTSLVSSKRYKSMTTEEKKKEIEGIYNLSQTKADHKVYGAKYAIKAIDKRGWGDSTKHQDQAEAYIQRSGSYEKYYNGYIGVEEVIRKSHYTGYESKAIGLKKAGADDSLYQIYGVYKKTKDRVDTYFKVGGGEGEYYSSLNKMTRIISSYGVSDSNLNKAMALSEGKTNKRVYNVLGLENQANTGFGLVQYKYTPSKISEMKDNLCYDFDYNGSGTPNKDEVVSYIESLGLSDHIEKALLFSAFSQAKNPYGTIPNYLGIDANSSGGSGYGRGYRRHGYSGRRGDSSTEEKTDFEKYIESLMRAQQSGSGIDEARMNYGSRKLNTKQYTSDQYRKAVARLLAKKLKA